MLAISAYHKASASESSDTFTVVAQQYLGVAKKLLVQEHTDAAAKQHAPRVVPFTMLVLTVVFLLGQCNDSQILDPLESLIVGLTLFSGSVALLASGHESILHSEAAVLNDHVWEREDVELEQDALGALDLVHTDTKGSNWVPTATISSCIALNPHSLTPFRRETMGLPDQTGSFKRKIKSSSSSKVEILWHSFYWLTSAVLLHHARRPWFFGDWAALT